MKNEISLLHFTSFEGMIG